MGNIATQTGSNHQQGALVCPYARKCGGCQLQNMDYPRQLAYKQAGVVKLLGSYCRVSPIIGMEHPYHYRNKVQAAFYYDKHRKKIVSGVYQSSTGHVVSVNQCMIEDKTADKIIGTIRKLMQSFKIMPFDAHSGKGVMRHVLVKRGFQSGQIMVVLVTATPIFPAGRQFIGALLKEHPQITTVIQNISEGRALTLGKTSKVLYGSGTIEEQLCGLTFRISAKSFYQVNPVQTEVLYRTAMEYAQLSGQETVVDAYCGTGTIGLLAAKSAGQVIGVENNRDAVKDAAANARLNKIDNAYFHCADAGQWMQEMAQEKNKVDVAFVDPPRAGCDEAFLHALAKLSPKRIVYISCNPQTQARDIALLVKNGYRVKSAQPVDMFPHTNHVECVALLIKG